MPAENGQPDNVATAITEVSERMSLLIREEVELAKAEMTQKATSIARGVAAVAAGAVFGVFAIVYFFTTLAWGLDAIFVSGLHDIWIGFAIVLLLLVISAILAFLFARKKLSVGTPAPTMALDEAKKIRDTVSSRTDD